MDDLIVIGVDQRFRQLAAALGKKVTIIENDTIGGTCVSYGCVPKKLWHAISVADHQFKPAIEMVGV